MTKPRVRRPSSTRAQHGSHYRYKMLGCRCPMGVEAHRRRTEESRMNRLLEGRLSHGTRSAYDAGCRCDDCRKARRDAYRRLERKVS